MTAECESGSANQRRGLGLASNQRAGTLGEINTSFRGAIITCTLPGQARLSSGDDHNIVSL